MFCIFLIVTDLRNHQQRIKLGNTRSWQNCLKVLSNDLYLIPGF